MNIQITYAKPLDQVWYLRASIVALMLCVFLVLEWEIGTEVGTQDV